MHQTFGTTGLAIPCVVFGTSSLGNLYQSMSDAACLEIVASWFAHVPPPVFIDTAGKYGASLALQRLGECLRQLDVDPKDVVISNKLGWVQMPLNTPEPTFEPGVWIDLQHDARQEISYEGILRCYEQGCEFLDPYLPTLVSVHDPDEYVQAASNERDRQHRWGDIGGAYEALAALRSDGRVRGVGVGAKDWRFVRDCEQRYSLDWVMIANSLTVHSHPAELVEYLATLAQRQIPVINSAVFNGGFLVGGDAYNYRPVVASSAEGAALLAWRERFEATCRDFGIRPAEACTAFGISPPAVVALALSSTKAARVADNVALVNNVVPAEFWAMLKDRGIVDEAYPHC